MAQGMAFGAGSEVAHQALRTIPGEGHRDMAIQSDATASISHTP